MRAIHLCPAILLALSVTAWSAVTLEPGRVALTNDHVARQLAFDGDAWRTVSIARSDGSDALALDSDEFLIRLMDGTGLTVADYRASGTPVCEGDGDRAVVRIHYIPRRDLPSAAPSSLTVYYWIDDSPYLRKSLMLVLDAQTAVDRLAVERFRTEAECDRGGRGEPVFMGDDWFTGLEYPGSQTSCTDGLVELAHFPGLAQQDPGDLWRIQSKTAVIGTGAVDDPLELAFSDYVDTIRRPTRNFMQYNSWYDWRGDELNVENLVGTFEGFKQGMLDPYGLQMDAFVPDDGWQDYQSIWMPRKNLYPEGFAPLRDALEARGTRLGIWMPLNGTNLDADWGAREGYEKSDGGGFYCLVGPKYNQAIRDATKRIIQQGNLNYYKHDFNSLHCTAKGHGHLSDARHGHEANLDAELDLLAYERELQPDIFLNVTSNVWLSPWWLTHADSIWMCASDFGYNKDYPQLTEREWDISYRDAHFYDVYFKQRHLVPVSAMMTHGIIHGKLCKLGGPRETLRDWSDCVAMYYGRGVQLKELYVSPEMLDADWWKVLGEATRWAVENTDVLEKVVMVGGDPRQGKAYGWVHWLGDRGILCLRNPAPFEQEISVPFDKSVKYRGKPGVAFAGRVIYPFVEALPGAFTSGEAVTLKLPGVSVMVYELRPGAAQNVPPASPEGTIAASGAAQLSADGKPEITLQVSVPDEDMPRCDLYLITTGMGRSLEFDALTVNGQTVKPRTASGTGWVLRSIDLTPYRGQRAAVRGTIPAGGDEAFSSPDVTLCARVVADRPVTAAPTPDEHLPFAISQGHRRQTVEALAETKLERAATRREVSAEDLDSIKAAKLRIMVFGANAEAQYAGKHILLNGEKLVPVPPNKGELDAWQEHIIDLTPEQMKRLKLSNVVELTNAGGDCYKVTGVALAVQLASGKWAESSADWDVHCSVDSWAHAEGRTFRGERSGEIKVGFE